jgi:hypothetical protein
MLHPTSLRQVFSGAFALLAALLVGTADAAPVTMSFINNSGVQNVYVTFNNNTTQPVFDVSYVDATSGLSVALTRNSSGFSSSIPLSSVKNGVFYVNNIQSGGFYVSYGMGLNGSSPAPLSTTDSLYGTQWFQVETTIFSPGDAANNGDFTAVNLFSGSVNIQNYNGSTVAGTVGFGSTDNASLFTSLNNALTASGELGTDTTVNGLNQQSVITTTVDNQTSFVRVMSPSNWGQTAQIPGGGAGYSVGPYHSFESYVTALKTLNAGGVQTTNLQYTFQTGNTTFNGNSGYTGGLRYVCTFTATPVSATINGSTNDTFSITGQIAVSALPYAGNGNTITPLGTITGLTANLPIDSTGNAELSYLIYAQPGNFTTNTVFNASGWTTGGINSTDASLAQQFILGDLQEGMLCGFVGSTVTLSAANCSDATYYGQQVKDVPSAVWWANYTGSMYSTLQPGSSVTDPFYSTYSSIIFPAGNTYSAPYDDRFQDTHNPDIAINTGWVITLNPQTSTPAPAVLSTVSPTLKIKRNSLSATSTSAKAGIEFVAKAGTYPVEKVKYKYTGKSGTKKINLPASGKKKVTLSGLPLDRQITVTAQSVDSQGNESKSVKLKFTTP